MSNSGGCRKKLSFQFISYMLAVCPYLLVLFFIIRSIGITNKPSQIRVCYSWNKKKRGSYRYESNTRDLLCQITAVFCVCGNITRISSWNGRRRTRTRRADFQQKPYYVEPNVRTKRRSTERGRKTKKIHVGTLESPEEMKSLEEIWMWTLSLTWMSSWGKKTKKMDFLLFFSLLRVHMLWARHFNWRDAPIYGLGDYF